MATQAFFFDPNRCTGCQACELACTIENELDAVSWRHIATLNEARRPEAPVVHLSMACNHCADAPCMKHCPALAYSKDPSSGIVTLHDDLCVGCRYCSWACPYDAPKFDDERGVMTKCTFCGHRQAEGLEPACVVQCPTEALRFGELDSQEGEESMVGMPTTVPGPSIRFTPWTTRKAEGLSPEPRRGDGRPAPGFNPGLSPGPSKITLASEWPLLGFTLIAAALVALLTASTFAEDVLSPPLFLVVAAFSMALSTLHLGKKKRAWRAMLNIRSSWLSREIVLYSGFVGLSALHFFLTHACPLGGIQGGERQWFGYGAVFLGFAALFAMDRVYDIVLRHEPFRLHSADVLLTGLGVTGLLLGNPFLFLGLGGLKSALYLARKVRYWQDGRDVRWKWSLLRVGMGFVLPLALGFAGTESWVVWALAGTVVGEIIDRGELYTELRVPTPRGQMAALSPWGEQGGKTLSIPPLNPPKGTLSF